MSEAERQKQYYDRDANAISLEPGNLVLAKADAYKGKRKVKNQWEEEPYEQECWFVEGNPFVPCEEPADRMLTGPPLNHPFLITPAKWTSLCSFVQAGQARCTTTTL